jgi:S-adenosylmethionine-diacylgycerolhomoserine-N-methlytransferase
MEFYSVITTTPSQEDKLQKYYRFQSKIYDLTRWSFLFGRTAVLDNIPLLNNDVSNVLEIGCGTGRNLIKLANKYPKAIIVGIDISEEMIERATEATRMYPNIQILKTTSIPDSYGNFDIVLMSYVLTMMNPGWEFWLKTTKNLLHPKGYFAVVDFNDSPFRWFKNHMANHHVKMEGHILASLKAEYKPFDFKISNAYFGIWNYFTFVGKPK